MTSTSDPQPMIRPVLRRIGHKLVRHLLPEYLEEIADAEARAAELHAEIKAAEAVDDQEEEDEGEDDLAITEEELKALKRERTAARRKVRKLRAAFASRLEEARSGLSALEARELVLAILRAGLKARLEREAAGYVREAVAVAERWWEKYRMPLREIERERDKAKGKLEEFLMEMGYGR